ncbi:hypothetical protein [Roseospira visakhapatnamensis]|uniref:DNA-binding transcriptional ArsR family regulator n=1 Tax=Roseospira visakhapatnamensis TaxID=390880 RepID=A0A7W6W952_9PROT|nr:hypothetical protein [Roseospira visakhapatnamensis]MBB4265116.1 DNA-binding transcriptional ArsR family regulator [Roseospira visakhapatnamensis]
MPLSAFPSVPVHVSASPSPRAAGTGAASPSASSGRGGVLALPVQARVLLADLMRAAEAGAPCPSNFTLMDCLGVASPDGVRKAMETLRTAGLITLETEGQRRRVTIRASGARTDWSRGRGHSRAGAAYADGWENGQDAILLRLAREGLDLATMATRLGRTPSSVRHRLRRLRAAGAGASPEPAVAPLPAAADPADPADPAGAGGGTCGTRGEAGAAPVPLSPVQRHIITTADRPEAERAQIAAFLAAGKVRKLPPAYAGEVRGGRSLAGVAPVSPLARRLLVTMDGRARGTGDLAARGRLDPLLMPELLRELSDAGLITGRRRNGCMMYRRPPESEPALRAMGLTRPTEREDAGGARPRP